jgi:hypothetical protein
MTLPTSMSGEGRHSLRRIFLGLKNGEIISKPNTIYWIKMPAIIGESDQVELLKNDILVIDCDYGIEDLDKIREKDKTNAAFFYNLDVLLSKNLVIQENLYNHAEKIAAFISDHAPERSIAHTFTIDAKMCDIFRSKGLIYIEKNLVDRTNAVSTIMNLLRPIFSDENKIKRSFFRINLYPSIKYRIEIVTCSEKKVNGFVKDLSLNGMGLIINEKEEMPFLKLKDSIQARIFTPTAVLKISSSYITRKDDEALEIGINYNINDKNMVKEDTANYLTRLIFYWIREILKGNGKG